MKAIIYLFLILWVPTLARTGKSLLTYEFKSDTFDWSVPKGMCLITGKVTSGKFSVNEGIVATADHKFSAPTDKLGKYKLLIPAQKTKLYFFKGRYNEIVTHEYEFKSGHKVVLDFFAHAEEKVIQVKKPVIYLYPKEKTDVSILLKTQGKITFSYPEIDKKWNFTVLPNGDIIDKKNGKTYPYLFWEAKQKRLFFQTEKGEVFGNIISEKEVVPFLESSLSELGLNDKEATDFITFWAPRMLKYENVLVQFVVDEEYSELISEMKITPKPDIERRVFMLFSEIKNPESYSISPPIKHKIISRMGFTVIEWGGSQIQLERDLGKL